MQAYVPVQTYIPNFGMVVYKNKRNYSVVCDAKYLSKQMKSEREALECAYSLLRKMEAMEKLHKLFFQVIGATDCEREYARVGLCVS